VAGRDRSGEPLLGARLSPALTGTVERVAKARHISKSALVRAALVAYLLGSE
jgi:predicted transcriptional regulator